MAEQILHLADIASVDCTFDALLAHGRELMAEMRQHHVPGPKSWSEFLSFQEGFVHYFVAELEQARASISVFDYTRLKRRAQQMLEKFAASKAGDQQEFA